MKPKLHDHIIIIAFFLGRKFRQACEIGEIDIPNVGENFSKCLVENGGGKLKTKPWLMVKKKNLQILAEISRKKLKSLAFRWERVNFYNYCQYALEKKISWLDISSKKKKPKIGKFENLSQKKGRWLR